MFGIDLLNKNKKLQMRASPSPAPSTPLNVPDPEETREILKEFYLVSKERGEDVNQAARSALEHYKSQSSPSKREAEDRPVRPQEAAPGPQAGITIDQFTEATRAFSSAFKEMDALRDTLSEEVGYGQEEEEPEGNDLAGLVEALKSFGVDPATILKKPDPEPTPASQPYHG